VGQPVLGDRGHAGIAKNRLVHEANGWIAVVGGLNVALQQAADARQAVDQMFARLGRALIADAAAGPTLRARVLAIEYQAAPHLLDQRGANALEALADVAAQGRGRELGRTEVPGKQQRPQVPHDGFRRPPRGQDIAPHALVAAG
jgi:hypothetical protein